MQIIIVKIVEEKATLRSLIKAANDIISYGYAETEEVDQIIDMAEKKIFEVFGGDSSTLANYNSKLEEPEEESIDFEELIGDK